MKCYKTIICAVLTLCLFQWNAKAVAADTLYANALKPLGRTLLNREHNLELITSAAHFGVSFEGNTCAVYVAAANAQSHNYVQYELDGVYQKKVRIDGNAANPLIIKAGQSGHHRLWIYKATEAHTGPLIISKLGATGIKSLPIPTLPLIEFIGNSITCGALSDTTEMPCGKGDYHDYHNAYMAYGPSVARALNANFVLASVSGIGIYRTWNVEEPSMPKVYENVDFQVGNPQKWNFSTYKPAIVSIALGTNDMSLGDGKPRAAFDSARFISRYIQFVQLVKSKYPAAQIVLLSSPMMQGDSREMLQECLTCVKRSVDHIYPKDKPVATFFFEPMIPKGCAFHPSVADHQILAAELKPFLARLLKK